MDFKNWLENEYRGNHTAPGVESSPLHDLSGTFPDDIYGPMAVRLYYGDGETISIIQGCHSQ